jgi:urease accessory protein
MTTMKKYAGCGIGGASLLLPVLAFAHPGHDTVTFADGFLHPLGGIDHLLAMVAVGVLASRFAGSARLLLPLAFMSAMTLGALLSVTALPFVETMIALSLVAFGLAIMHTRTLPLSVGMLAVFLFGVFHGHAHGTEAHGGLMPFAAGFLLSTGVLHALGLAATARLQQATQRYRLALRTMGGIVAGAGVVLLGVG